MIPPPSSQFVPQSTDMYPSPNKLTQKFQDMKLSPAMPQNMTLVHPSSQQVSSPNAPPFPSPQHKPVSTMVTYSSQPRATYPYVNNNPPPNTFANNNPFMTSSPIVHQTSPTTNGAVNGHQDFQEKKNPLDQGPLPQSPVSPSGFVQHSPGTYVDPSRPPPVPPSQSNLVQSPVLHSGRAEPSSRQGSYPSAQPALQNSPSRLSAGQQCPPASPPAQGPYSQPSSLPRPPPGPQNPPSGPYSPPGQPYPPAQGSHPPPQPSSPSKCLPGQQYPNYSPPMGSLSTQSPPSLYPQYPPQTPAGYSPMPPAPNSPGSVPGSPHFTGMPPPHPMNYPSPGGQGANAYPYASQPAFSPQQQPARKLELDQMPSVVQVREDDKKTRSGYFPTDVKGQPPPLISTNFIVQDRGMCSPRFIRSSVYCLPNNPDVLKQTALPFAVTISPLASIEEGESDPPLCLYREQGPLRCKRCKAYVCPFMTFLEGGRAFQCAFCKVVTEVPQDYFCFLDGMGERTDKYHRPELCLGSYEFMASKEYCRNDELPNPPAYLFMIEVSSATFRNGLVPLLCENLKNILQCLRNDEKNDTSKLKVGFVTYNNVLHFYNLKKNLTQPHIMVLSDVHNAFVPLLDGFLVSLSEAEALVECLMEHIPRLFINEPATEIILGPVIQVGLEALKNANCSGKLLVFHSTIPNADAPGKLPHRDGQKLLGTEKQKTVLSPQNDFYNKLAQDCIAGGCAVDLFLFPNAYVDIASMTPLCRHTGGQIYKYTYFQSHVDGDRFLEDLERNITTTTAFDAVLRVRTSTGISPIFYYGNFYMSNATDVELSAMDCHKAITVEMAYDEKLPENETVYLQAALLYTACNGDRRIRVHNLALATSAVIADVFKSSELDTIINFFAKQALKQVLEVAPQQIKNNLISRAVKMLTCYRKHCATSSPSGQLILPDSLKLLPVYVTCLLRSDAIVGGPELSLDDRSFAMLAVNSMDVKSTAVCLYPTLIPLHDVDPDKEEFPMPVRCSIEKLSDSGVYLLENGIYMFLWIGQAVDPEWLQNVFGVQSTNHLDKQKSSLPELNTPLSHKIRQLIENLEEGRQWYMRLTVMVQGDKLEIVFRQFLVEDKCDGSPSYVDLLCHLHREISKNL